LDRCIIESAAKIRWLCLKNDRECFVRYLADGLKKDLQLLDTIWANVATRDGQVLVIEQRMIDSITQCLAKSGLTEKEARDAAPLPDLASMYRDLELDEYYYLAFQRIGSHSVHGTWSDLYAYYLEQADDGRFYLQDHGAETQDIQYISI